MTWVDGAVLGVIALSALFSMVRGFVREVLGVGAWVGAGFAARYFYPYAVPYVASVVPAKNNLPLYVSIAVVFLLALVLLSVISAVISGRVQNSALSSLDRSLGLVFGLARGALVVCLAYVALSVAVPPANWPLPVANARLLPAAFQGANALVTFLPADDRPKITPPPTTPAPTAGALMQQPVAGSALRTE